MTQYEKLLKRVLAGSNLTHAEATLLLTHMGYRMSQGKGSRVHFDCPGKPPVYYHVPHGGQKELKNYVMNDIRQVVEKEVKNV